MTFKNLSFNNFLDSLICFNFPYNYFTHILSRMLFIHDIINYLSSFENGIFDLNFIIMKCVYIKNQVNSVPC